MASRRSALGRGLEALIPRSGEQPAGEAVASAGLEAEGGALELPVERIVPNPEQPRRHFDAGELERLAESIRRHGILQPVVVRRAGEDWELVVGERRWRAARAAGLGTIPAVVADVASRDRLELALVENVQRRDLNPIELALAFHALAQAGATHDQIGGRVGLDRSSVSNHIRLLDLPRAMQEDVEEGRVSFGHAKALLSVSNPERRRTLRDRIVRDGLSVRQTEEAARAVSGVKPRRRREAEPAPDADTRQLLDGLRDRLKTRVRLVGGVGRGRLEIEYFGPEELHRISAIILGEA